MNASEMPEARTIEEALARLDSLLADGGSPEALRRAIERLADLFLAA